MRKKAFRQNISKNILFWILFIVFLIHFLCVVLHIMINKTIPYSSPPSYENIKTNVNQLSTNRNLNTENSSYLFKKENKLLRSRYELNILDKEPKERPSFSFLFYKLITNKSIFLFFLSSHYKKEIITLYIILRFDSVIINELLNLLFITNEDLFLYSKEKRNFSLFFNKSFYSYLLYVILINLFKRLSFQYDELNLLLKDCPIELQTLYSVRYNNKNQFKLYTMFSIQGILEIAFIYCVSIFYCVFKNCFVLWIFRVCVTFFISFVLFLLCVMTCITLRLLGYINTLKIADYIEVFILK